VLSGPLVGAVELTGEGGFDPADLDEGRATVANATLPDQATISRADFGAETLYLEVPAATIDVEDVSGRARVSYKIAIDDLGFSRGTTHFLGQDSVGGYELTMERVSFDPNRITEDRYDATLTIEIFEGETVRTIATRNVTVAVNR
jgi:hypothetical protein